MDTAENINDFNWLEIEYYTMEERAANIYY